MESRMRREESKNVDPERERKRERKRKRERGRDGNAALTVCFESRDKRDEVTQ